MIGMIADVVIGLVSALHASFLILEMFLWTHPIGLQVFRQTAEQAAATKTLAANQGLYNGFLAAGLVWGLLLGSAQIKIFFLACVVIAGFFGAVTANRRILWIQALPAAVALTLTILARRLTIES